MLRLARSRPSSGRPVFPALLLLVVLVLGLAAARPAGAHAGGLPYESSVDRERALLSLEDGREEIVLGLDLAAPGTPDRPGRPPAVLLPVPATPTVTVLSEGAAGIFDELETATRPVPRPGDDGTDRADAPAGGGVSVLSRGQIGGYDVTRLRAGDAAALRAWLDRSGYVTPTSAEPILRDYVRRSWAFVAIRPADPVRGGPRPLRPLRVSFASDALIYPLRLGAAAERPVDVQLYVTGEHRVLARGFNTFYAGSVAALRPALSPDVRRIVRGRYLTRLGIASSDPARIRTDVRFREGASDRLFRASTGYPYETEDNFALGPLPRDLPGQGDDAPLTDAPGGAAWLVLVPAIGLSVLAVFGVLRLRERLRRRA